MAADHDCLEHLDYHEKQFSQNVDVEVDGGIERWWEQWLECAICHEKYTMAEADRMAAARSEA